MKKKLLLLFIIIVMSSFFYFGQSISLEYVQSIRAKLEEFVRHHYVPSVMAYMLIYTIVVALSVPITAILTTTGGFLFGTVKGTFFAVTAGTLGATLAFLLMRYFFSPYLKSLYRPRLASFYREIQLYGFWYLLALRLMPLLPFFLETFLAAWAPIKLPSFIAATALGIVPGTLVFAYTGRSLAMIHSMADIFSFRIIMLSIILGLIALLPVLIRPRKQP